MIIKDDFADLEQMRLKHLEDKIIDALIEFDKDKEMQWIGMRFEKVLLETLLKAVEKQISNKPLEQAYVQEEFDSGTDYLCPNCKTLVGAYSDDLDDWCGQDDCCTDCGQKIDWEEKE